MLETGKDLREAVFNGALTLDQVEAMLLETAVDKARGCLPWRACSASRGRSWPTASSACTKARTSRSIPVWNPSSTPPTAALMAAPLAPELASDPANHHVMTLATQGGDGPWAAAVFYAWVDGALIFLSSPKSRHAANLAQDGRCAATIQQEDYSDWQQIKGVQVEGRVQQLHGEDPPAPALPMRKNFPSPGPWRSIPPAIAEAFARVSWYRLAPVRLYFIDNAKGFGHRDEIGLA